MIITYSHRSKIATFLRSYQLNYPDSQLRTAALQILSMQISYRGLSSHTVMRDHVANAYSNHDHSPY